MSLSAIITDLAFIGLFIYLLVTAIHHFNYDIWSTKDRNILAVFDILTIVFYMLAMFSNNNYLTVIFIIIAVLSAGASQRHIFACNKHARQNADKELHRLESQDHDELNDWHRK